MGHENEPFDRGAIENIRKMPTGVTERRLISTIDQRDQGISDLTLAIHAERRERQRLQETVDAERQWYPCDVADQPVVLCLHETVQGWVWDAVFRDRAEAEAWSDAHGVYPEEEALQYDVMSGRMAGLKIWNGTEPMPGPQMVPDAVRALRAAAILPCERLSQHLTDDEVCASTCDTCLVRRAARIALRAMGVEVTDAVL